MRFIILILFLGFVLAEEKVAKADDKQSEPAKVNPVEEVKSKTEKRDSSVQTSSFGINSNAEPFKPMLNPPVKYEVAASTNQQVYYGNKNAVTAGNAKNGASSHTPNAFRGQYSQVATQTQPQQQQQPLLNKNAGKNVGAQQQQIQQQILYAVPQNPPNHYERVSQQTPLQQQPVPVQRKQSQYVIAIPLSYLRQLQQQLVQHPQQQQHEQPSNLQIYKGQQQFQLQPQQQQQAIYSIAGPLARDHQGAYRPFHRFALTPVNDVLTAGVQHHQIGSPAPIPPPALAPAPAPPGYVTQYVQIPASVLMAALQSTQVQPQQRPVHLAQPVYQQPQHPQQQFQQQALQQPQQQLQPQVQYQQTIPQQQQQHIQSPASQIFYLQPHPQQQLQPSQALTAPPVYAYHVNPLQQQQQQLQQPTQQHQQYVAEQQQQQQVNVGKQTLRVRGIGSQVNYAPPQYDASPSVYEHAHSPTYTNAHGQQYIAQDPIAQPAQSHQVVQAQQLQSPDTYEQVIHHHYSPQHHTAQQQQPQQQLRQSYQPQQHRFQVQPTASAPQLQSSPPPPPPPPSPSSPPAPQQQQPQHSTPFVEHLNNLQLSQGIHGPTPLPYLDLHPPSAVAPYYNFNVIPPTVPQPFATSALQHSFTPLGIPNKVASFTNVVFQPFGGHAAPYHVQEINSAVAGSADTVPYFHQAGGVRYGAHVLHPPTSAATYLAGGKPTAAVVTHPSNRVSNEQKISASSAKSSVAGNPNLQVIHHHYSPQHHTAQQQQPQQQLRQSYQPQQHRFQVQPTASAPQLQSSPPPPPPPPSPSSPPAPQQQQPQHSTPFVEHLNNLQLSQGIHGPTPLPYLDLHPPSAVAPYYNFNVIPPTVPQPFATSALQHSFTPLGIPNKVASFTNVVFQPFGGHAAPYHVQEINSAVAGSADTVPYFHQAGGVRYGAHVLHPPTSAATYLAGGKPTAAVVTHPSNRVSNEQKISASSAKSSVAGNPNLVKYP